MLTSGGGPPRPLYCTTMRPVRRPRKCIVFVTLGFALLAAATAPAETTGRAVREAIRRGVRVVQLSQSRDGSWPERNYPGGATCLATLALLQTGVSPDSPAITRALPVIRKIEDERTYVVALKIMVLAKVDPEQYRPEIVAATRWLVDAQNESGLWNYTQRGPRFDHSNSQFALLGLHTAAQVGVSIPDRVWRRARRVVRDTQNEDGGWCYQVTGNSYGSMTAAGVADLLILGIRIGEVDGRLFGPNEIPCCGRTRADRHLARGLKWLAENFRADRNPPHDRQHLYYYLYAVERCGILSGQRYFGAHDWYREGAEYLVDAQRVSGRWNDSLIDTCFALLFLAKGHKSLVVQKLAWSSDPENWSPNRNDLANLTAYIDDQLGEPVASQTTALAAPLEEWLAAPLLFIQGVRFPELDDAERAKLRAYVQQGGTLLIEATCTGKRANVGARDFARRTFPESPLRQLGKAHAVYHVVHDIEPLGTGKRFEPYGLEGIDVGCRTGVIFSPRDLSCSWELGDIPVHSERAFQLGTNIAAYAIGRRPLIDRLDSVVLPKTTDSPEEDDIGAGALRLAQVVYEGDWRPFPLALTKLATALQTQLNMDVVPQYRQVRLTDDRLYRSPILWIAGHYGVELKAAERAALRQHLERGGVLVADACCGMEPFNTSFRELVQELFPEQTLQRLPRDHPIYNGEPGFSLTRVGYTPDVLRIEPGRDQPELWGLELDGRLAIIYSPYSLSCGLSGSAFDGCWGLTSEDARKLAMNIILYALTH